MSIIKTPNKPYGTYEVKKRRNVYTNLGYEYVLLYNNWALRTWDNQPSDGEITAAITLVERAWEVLLNVANINIQLPIAVKPDDNIYYVNY